MKRYLINVRGIVQGVGFRYFTYNTASSLGLSGWVTNSDDEEDLVIAEAQGGEKELFRFISELNKGSVSSKVKEVNFKEIPADNEQSFQIIRF